MAYYNSLSGKIQIFSEKLCINYLRVAIARALASNAPVILADEPTGNLDDKTAFEIMSLFKKIAKEDNKCVIIVTHSKDISMFISSMN